MAKKIKQHFSVGIDIGATKILAVVFDGRFNPVASARKKTKAHEGPGFVLDRVLKTVLEALEEANVPLKQLSAIGAGCPGPVDLRRGIIVQAPNLGWKNLNLQAFLEKKLGGTAAVLNDVDAGVYGEYRFGSGREAHCVAGIFPGTGIGGGCIYDGGILHGTKMSCFEIGHVIMLPDGPLCGCGKRGCLEALASRLAVSSAVAAAAYRGEAPNLVKKAGFDITHYGSGVLAQAIRDGDQSVERIVRNAAQWLGKGAALLSHLLSPDVVVLGGGMVEAMPKLFLEEVRASADKAVLDSYRHTFKIRIAELGDLATAMGAAAWALRRHTERVT